MGGAPRGIDCHFEPPFAGGAFGEFHFRIELRSDDGFRFARAWFGTGQIDVAAGLELGRPFLVGGDARTSREEVVVKAEVGFRDG